MDIVSVRVFSGRNIHTHYPAAEVLVDLGSYADALTSDIVDFTESILTLLPGLKNHHCSTGKPGGFVNRLREGTGFAHVIEHVVLELQALLGSSMVYGKTRAVSEPGFYRVVFEHDNEFLAEDIAFAAVGVVKAAAEGQGLNFRDEINRLSERKRQTELGQSTAAIAEEAKRRGIPVIRVGAESLLQLGHGCRSRRVRATITDSTSCLAVDLACDKLLTKTILEEAGIPVPRGPEVFCEEEAVAAAARLGGPVVVKPSDSNQGRGVALNLTTEQQVRRAVQVAQNYCGRVIVEEYIEGRHYRLLVVNGKLVAAAERLPAQVVGNGQDTIRALIDKVNQDPRRGYGHEKPLTRIKVDPLVIMALSRRGLSLDHVPALGDTVVLRDNANLSTGGTARDVTDQVHPSVADLAVHAAEVIGLDVAGIDLVTNDIRLPTEDMAGAVIEVNAAPGLRMHQDPSEGKPRNPARDIVDMLMPGNERGRIPIAAVTGTNGKTTVCRLIAHALGCLGAKVGLATTDGIWIGAEKVMCGDTTGPRSARTVLADRRVEAAVLETARGGMIERGLGFDACDVAVMTNIAEDHIGDKGVTSIEDLVWVKSLLLEAVPDDGYSVLNADDTWVMSCFDQAGGKKVLYSLEECNPLIARHCSEGGKAVIQAQGSIWLLHGQRGEELVTVKEVPITLGGMATFNIENALAATAAAWALGVPIRTLREALVTFKPDSEHNPGRLNLVQTGGPDALVDYAHNTPALEAIGPVIRNLTAGRKIGVVASPGDRSNQSIIELGRRAGQFFDGVVIKEDGDLRGRGRGEVAGLIREGALKAGLPEAQIEVVLDEEEAVKAGLALGGPGDIVVILYEKYGVVMRAIEDYSKALRRRALSGVSGDAPGVQVAGSSMEGSG